MFKILAVEMQWASTDVWKHTTASDEADICAQIIFWTTHAVVCCLRNIAPYIHQRSSKSKF